MPFVEIKNKIQYITSSTSAKKKTDLLVITASTENIDVNLPKITPSMHGRPLFVARTDPGIDEQPEVRLFAANGQTIGGAALRGIFSGPSGIHLVADHKKLNWHIISTT